MNARRSVRARTIGGGGDALPWQAGRRCGRPGASAAAHASLGTRRPVIGGRPIAARRLNRTASALSGQPRRRQRNRIPSAACLIPAQAQLMRHVRWASQPRPVIGSSGATQWRGSIACPSMRPTSSRSGIDGVGLYKRMRQWYAGCLRSTTSAMDASCIRKGVT